jgi:hypothetical protein
MKKKLVNIAVCLAAVIAIVMMAACEDVLTAEPTGSYRALPGNPGGGSVQTGGGNQSGPGWGTPDPSYTGRRFDINNLPPPATWNALGHQHAFPDPFHFANGNRVVTVEDWENRRKEISRIMQYYEYGIVPSIAPEDIDITWVDSGTANCTITVTHRASGRTLTFTQNTTLPSNLATAANEGQASLPLYFGSSGANWEGGTGSFNQGTFGSEDDGSGSVHTLFGINTNDGSAPSANSDYAWGMSIILTVIEGIDRNGDGEIGPGERGFRGYYDPNKVGITGYSRNGKAAMCIAAFAESRKGSRIGHASIGSAGSGGPAIERFLSPAGYRVNGQFADPLPLDGPGIMEFDGLIGKPWYLKKINNGDPLEGTNLTYEATPGGSSDDFRYKAVRGWSPYFEAYDQTPTTYSTAVTTPFIGWQSPAETWSGIQSLSEGRNETPGWFSVRFREFADLHYGLDIDHVRGMEGRSKYGILCTIPMDQHYLGVLIAGPGRGMILQDGYVVPRNNPESQFAQWLIADEVYKLYGEAEGDPEKYIWNNAFMITWGTHGGNTGNEAADRNYHAMKIFNGEATSDRALSDPNLMKLRTPVFQVDDPISRYDFYRMTWGRPGHPTIAKRVQDRVEPILNDYVEGERNRPFPAAFAPAIHPNYTPTGPKFKAMDWRGLLDTPEPLI